MSLLKKITYSLLVAIFISVSCLYYFAKPAKAQVLTPGTTESAWFDTPNYFDWYLKVYNRRATPVDEIFGERYTAAQVEWVLYTVPSMVINNLLGWDIASCLITLDFGDTCLGSIKDRVDSLTNPFGKVGKIPDPNYYANKDKNFIQILASHDMSGVGYISRLVNKLSPVKEVYAQTGGFGYNTGAAPVQKLWQATRNISYGLLVIVTVILAFMIMFRVKLSPQTVVTVQSALPKVIITIILITFSFAIAGLLIDLMYVVIGLLSIIAHSATGLTDLSTLEMFRALTDTNTVLGLVWLYLLWWFLASLSVIFSANWLGGILAVVFTLGIIILVLWYSIKVVWLTIKTFLMVLLLIVVGPIQILLGAVTPGMGMGSWIKSMLANLMVYPTLGGMFLLAFMFLRAAAEGSTVDLGSLLGFPLGLQPGFLSQTGWQPPLSFGTSGLRFLWLMASFAVFAGIPKVADIIKGLIEGKPYAYGTAIGEALGTINTVSKGVVGGTIRAYENAHGTTTPLGSTLRSTGWIK